MRATHRYVWFGEGNGQVTPAREMIAAAHRHGALALVDGAQSLAHRRTDVQALDADFFVLSGHKMFAPPALAPSMGRKRAGVVSFVLDGVRTEDVGKALDREGIAVRAGRPCPQPILRRFGLESSVRPSFALHNAAEDVEALLAAVQRIALEAHGSSR